MRHHTKSLKRQFFYIGAALDEPCSVSSARPTPYETKIMSIRPIPGLKYTEVPKNTKKQKEPVPVWKYIEKHGSTHFDSMLAAGRIKLLTKGGVSYCQEL